MGFESRIPEIIQQASLRTQKAVEFAGQEIEFDARRRARKRTGDMAAGIQWKPSRTNRGGLVTSGRVVGKDFKTRWHEYGTKQGLTAQPMLGPAARHAGAAFLRDMSQIYK
jgi:hypothetical protein